MDGAYVELNRSAECDWPEAVFEMAHETVHLLNPVLGDTNNFEEGIAVAFSLSVQPSYGINVSTSEQPYLDALQLASVLPAGPLEAGRRVRDSVGALSAVTQRDLRELFPDADVFVLSKLVETFVSDAGGA